MTIVNRLTPRNYISFFDLADGDLFVFGGESTLYMKCDESYVDMANGVIYSIDYDATASAPVYPIKGRLIIEGYADLIKQDNEDETEGEW